jgi:F-type H+-transporting ATPase subunit epsilon
VADVGGIEVEGEGGTLGGGTDAVGDADAGNVFGVFVNVLMVDAAEWPEEIDHDRARAAKQEAEETLATAMLKFENDNAREKLRRAEFRLRAWEMRA